jgi:hypothetical protein
MTDNTFEEGVFNLNDLKEYKIPIYKCDKKRLYPALKKNKK